MIKLSADRDQTNVDILGSVFNMKHALNHQSAPATQGLKNVCILEAIMFLWELKWELFLTYSPNITANMFTLNFQVFMSLLFILINGKASFSASS